MLENDINLLMFAMFMLGLAVGAGIILSIK